MLVEAAEKLQLVSESLVSPSARAWPCSGRTNHATVQGVHLANFHKAELGTTLPPSSRVLESADLGKGR
eukprot:3481333-Amphidinium_carterae.1